MDVNHATVGVLLFDSSRDQVTIHDPQNSRRHGEHGVRSDTPVAPDPQVRGKIRAKCNGGTLPALFIGMLQTNKRNVTKRKIANS
jgi:hypothetical protein